MSKKKKYLERKVECPRCFIEAAQGEVKVFGPNINIDICSKCGGIWLDHGELKKLLKDKKLSDYLTKDIGIQSKSKLICPRCGSLMDLEHADDVEVDVCLSCNGVWLDAGELDGLKSKSKAGFEGDEIEKAEEKYEEMVQRSRTSLFNRFIKKLGR